MKNKDLITRKNGCLLSTSLYSHDKEKRTREKHHYVENKLQTICTVFEYSPRKSHNLVSLVTAKITTFKHCVRTSNCGSETNDFSTKRGQD